MTHNHLTYAGRKWTKQVYDVFNDRETIRFNQLLNHDNTGNISPKTLSDRLKKGIELGLLEKQRFKEVPPRTEYTLTDKGTVFTNTINAFIQMDGGDQ